MIWWSHVNLFTRKIFLINLLFNMEKIHNIFFPPLCFCVLLQRASGGFSPEHTFLNKKIPRAESGCWVTSQSFPHFWQRTLLTHIRSHALGSRGSCSAKNIKWIGRVDSHRMEAAYFLPTTLLYSEQGRSSSWWKTLFSAITSAAQKQAHSRHGEVKLRKNINISACFEGSLREKL